MSQGLDGLGCLFLEFDPVAGLYGLIGEDDLEGESLDELQGDYYRVMIEEYLGFTGMKPAGFIFCAWRMPGLRVSGRPAEEVLREFFTASLGS